jgi:hypothetical protein
MKFNPNAVVFWVLAALVGYLMAGQHGALVGLAWALGLSLASSIHGALLVAALVAFVVWVLV